MILKRFFIFCILDIECAKVKSLKFYDILFAKKKKKKKVSPKVPLSANKA